MSGSHAGVQLRSPREVQENFVPFFKINPISGKNIPWKRWNTKWNGWFRYYLGDDCRALTPAALPCAKQISMVA